MPACPYRYPPDWEGYTTSEKREFPQHPMGLQNMRDVVVITNHNDWEAVYVDGDFVEEGHSVSYPSEKVAAALNVCVTKVVIDDELMETLCYGFPDTIVRGGIVDQLKEHLGD